MVTAEECVKFETLCRELPKPTPGHMGIGTQSEKTLHRVIKHYLCPDTDCHEVMVGTHVADAVVDNCIYEIQCGGLFPLKKKLTAYLTKTDKTVVIVCPFPVAKKLIWVEPESGEMSLPRRTSPGYGKMRILSELIYLLDHLDFARVEILPIGLGIDEYRLRDGYGDDKKKKATRLERVPRELISLDRLQSARDIADFFLPKKPAGRFTAADFSKLTHLKRRALSAALKVLLTLSVIKHDTKEGNRIYYRMNSEIIPF